MRISRSLAIAFVGVTIIAACGGAGTGGGATSSPGQKVALKIMVGGISKQIYLPNMLTEKLGYFVEQNLDVTLIDEPSGQSSEVALLAGEVDAGSGSYDHAIDLQGAGKNIIDIVQLLNAPGEAVMVPINSTIKSAADFKGKNLGVTSIGSGTHTLMNYLAVHNNIALPDIHPIAVGAGATFIAALTQGKIDAGMTTQPTVLQLIKANQAKILIDFYTPEATRAALGGDYPFIAIWMKNDYVAAHKDVVQRLVNAYVKTLKWMQTHTAADIADKLPADYYGGDKQAYVDALNSSMKMFSPDGVMPKGAPEFELSVLNQFDDNVKGKTIDLSKTYTTEFVQNAK